MIIFGLALAQIHSFTIEGTKLFFGDPIVERSRERTVNSVLAYTKELVSVSDRSLVNVYQRNGKMEQFQFNGVVYGFNPHTRKVIGYNGSQLMGISEVQSASVRSFCLTNTYSWPPHFNAPSLPFCVVRKDHSIAFTIFPVGDGIESPEPRPRTILMGSDGHIGSNVGGSVIHFDEKRIITRRQIGSKNGRRYWQLSVSEVHGIRIKKTQLIRAHGIAISNSWAVVDIGNSLHKVLYGSPFNFEKRNLKGDILYLLNQ